MVDRTTSPYSFLFIILSLCTLAAAGCSTRTVSTPDTGTGGTDGAVGVDTGPGGQCFDGRRNGSETSIDCGGSECPACADGAGCLTGPDCESGVCRAGFCLVPSCTDGFRNGDETGADCGGETCDGCPGGQPCMDADDCLSAECAEGMCQTSSCEDGVKNEGESDVDCGGETCPACAGGQGCNRDEDCSSFNCDRGTCIEASCSDDVLNQDETAIDCGGSCTACRDGLSCSVGGDCLGRTCEDNVCVSCMDEVQNQDETGVDCGGSLCDPCTDGMACAADTDCTGGRCEGGLCISCVDSTLNGDETDVDCGGTLCGGCADGLVCLADTDCTGGRCESGLCISCMDSTLNGDESDTDCGGTLCPACTPGRVCGVNADCDSNICVGGLCSTAGCTDGVLNQDESDIDCGGAAATGCFRCLDGDTCNTGQDCTSGVCTGGVCQVPACDDGVRNGTETDVDCGGPLTNGCDRCPDFRLCDRRRDCLTNQCTDGVCGNIGCIPFTGTSTDAFGYFGCSLPLTPATLPCPDISGTGTGLTLSDDSQQVVPMGFTFNFYGANYTEATVQSNGGITFDGVYFTLGNVCLPDASTTRNEYIAVMWDDLDPGNGTGASVVYETRGAAPNRQFIVRWDTERFSTTPSRAVFTAVLQESSNDIKICYHDSDFGTASYDDGASATAGIRGDVTNYLQYSCNTPDLIDGLYLQYFYPRP